MRRISHFAGLFFLLALNAWAWHGEVVSIIDGDTAVLNRDGKQVTIKLYGIDCPEKEQDFGAKATQYLSELIQGKTIRVEDVEYNQNSQLVAKLYLPDGVSLSEKIIEAGLGWVYDEYCDSPECQHWKELQAKAKANLDGLWAMNSPVPPWEYRNSTSIEAPQTIVRPAPATEKPTRSITVYITRTGSKYHRSSCSYLRQSRIPITLENAKAQGYGPYSRCNPPR